jgi:hypothetical protein
MRARGGVQGIANRLYFKCLGRRLCVLGPLPGENHFAIAGPCRASQVFDMGRA